MFVGDASAEVPDWIQSWLDSVTPAAILPEEVGNTIWNMKPGKSSSIASYCIEYLRGHLDKTLWHILAKLLTKCV